MKVLFCRFKIVIITKLIEIEVNKTIEFARLLRKAFFSPFFFAM